jgi:hypothetical protein
LTDVSEVLAASIIALMMEPVSTHETSVNIYQTTRRSFPKDSSPREPEILPFDISFVQYHCVRMTYKQHRNSRN